MNECTFTIEKKIAVLSGNEDGVRKEINVISWNEKASTIDIRAWSRDGKKPYKGISLTISEAQALKTALNSLEMLK